jgi:MFS family permease
MWQVQAPLAGWAVASILLGLGFTFFSGATEAWLVDALHATGYQGNLETVFGRGQAVAGAAMLTGSVAGGIVAQLTDLGVPYLLRAGMLGLALGVAYLLMRDLGFSPRTDVSALTAVREVTRGSIDGGLRNPPVRWLMLAAPFTAGVGFYVFYAMQPYLLELFGDPGAYSVAGLAAAIVAGAQMVGGLAVPAVRRRFRRRTDLLILTLVLGSLSLVGLWAVGSAGAALDGAAFVLAIALLVAWALVSALAMPVRAAFLNGVIPSAQRATVLSFDSLMGSLGGVVSQPLLGRVADVSGYAASYLVAAGISTLALPFVFLARRERASSDVIDAPALAAATADGP